jgi:DNA-directed RNA polymerase specialized sigma24 family protein
MNLPEHINAEEFEKAIEKIMAMIRRKYKYSIHDGEDLAQEALFIAIVACDSYKPEKGALYNFLSISVSNRIKNFIRNKRHRELNCVSIFNIEEETIKIGNMKTSSDEFWNMIDENLSSEYRADYLKIRQGISLPKIRKIKLMAELKRIVDEYL